MTHPLRALAPNVSRRMAGTARRAPKSAAAVRIAARFVPLGRRFPRPRWSTVSLPVAFVVVGCGVAGGYTGSSGHLKGDPLLAWTGREAAAQREAITWVRDWLPPTASIIVDDYLWTDLHDPKAGTPYVVAHYYQKVGKDPEILDGIFSRTWESVDYLVVTDQIRHDAAADKLLVVGDALAHSTPITSWDTGGWSVTIARSNRLQAVPAEEDSVLARIWERYRASSVDQVEDASRLLTAAIVMNDRPTFETARSALAGATVDVGLPGAAIRSDIDVALALLMGATRWHDDGLRADSQSRMNRIWAFLQPLDRLRLPGYRAGTGTVDVPLEALAPHAFRAFATVDAGHPWQAAVDGSYRVLDAIADQVFPATKGPTRGLPVAVRISLGQRNELRLSPPTSATETGGRPAGPTSGSATPWFTMAPARVGADLGWSIALDAAWSDEPRARSVVARFRLAGTQLGDPSLEPYRDLKPAEVTREAGLVNSAQLVDQLIAGEREKASEAYAAAVLRPAIGAAGGGLSLSRNGWQAAWWATAVMDGGLANIVAGQDTISWVGSPATGS